MKFIKRIPRALVKALFVFINEVLYPVITVKKEITRPFPTNSGGWPARRNEDQTTSKHDKGPK